MFKLWASIKKEAVLLLRDLGALIILFVMPLVLIITITLIQQGSFKAISDAKIPVVLIDNDGGSVAQGIRKNLESGGNFDIISTVDGKPLNEEMARNEVFAGKFPMAVIVPEKLSEDLNKKVQINVDKILKDVGLGEDGPVLDTLTTAKEIRLYFDPATQMAFKSAVKNNIDKMVSELEVQAVYNLFQEQLSDSVSAFSDKSFLQFREIMPIQGAKELIPNATQHNVPAWTLFAIFFIVIPLSINLVKEKGQGTLVRLRTLPMPYFLVIMGKTVTFLVICMIQFYLMVAVGVWLFPHLGLEPLQVEGKMTLMSLVAFCSGFAAIGFGILLGTISETQEQSAPFGATSVVILAAIGGVWVPVFAMPEFMQLVSGFSPMNWGLNAFYDVILRNAGLVTLLPRLSLLLVFYALMTGIALVYDEKKRAV
jgi:ABC-2 type transport system permease protein